MERIADTAVWYGRIRIREMYENKYYEADAVCEFCGVDANMYMAHGSWPHLC